MLNYIEKDDKRLSKPVGSKGNLQKGQGGGKGKGTKYKGQEGYGSSIYNLCKLPVHKGHDWSDCFFNPMSKNFQGAACTPKYYDRNGELKKESKEKKQSFHNEQKKSWEK